MFGTLLERPRIHQLFSPNYSVLLDMFSQEVGHCQFILDQHKDGVRQIEIMFLITRTHLLHNTPRFSCRILRVCLCVL